MKDHLNKYFDYPVEIRKATDGKRVFLSGDSLLKSLYIIAIELDRKSSISGWGWIYGQLSILFEGRI